MRNNENYKKLVSGYAFGLGLLKQYNKKAYKFFMSTQKLFDENGNKFARLVNCLRVDFSRGNDEKEIEEPEVLVDIRPFLKKTYAMSYLPAFDYALSVLCETETRFKKERFCCILYPVNEEYIRANTVVPVFELSGVKPNGEVSKTICYEAGFTDDELVIVKKDEDRPFKAKAVKSIAIEKLEGIGDEYVGLF